MHGVKKVRQSEIDEKQKALNAAKVEKFKELYTICFDHRNNGDSSREVFNDLDRLLEINPENYTMWNYRRSLLEKWWREEEEAQGAEQGEAMRQQDLMKEMELNTSIILKDYKVYAAFVHRKWVIERIQPAEARLRVLAVESKKCEGLLKMDERNFHAWGYRRWVTGHLGPLGAYDDDAELKFTSTKIGQNLSNYSAWHNRALCFQNTLRQIENDKDQAAELKAKLSEQLVAELDTLLRAFYCDAADQSSWLYARWVMETLRGVDKIQFHAMIEKLLESCQELIEADEEDEGLQTIEQQRADGLIAPAELTLKWPLWFSMHLLGMLQLEGKATAPNIDSVVDERKLILERLTKVDPPRQEYYKYLLAGGGGAPSIS